MIVKLLIENIFIERLGFKSCKCAQCMHVKGLTFCFCDPHFTWNLVVFVFTPTFLCFGLVLDLSGKCFKKCSFLLTIMSGESLDHLLQLKDTQQHFQQPIKKYVELDWIGLNWIWHFSRGKSLFTGEMINLLFWRLTHHFPLATFTQKRKLTFTKLDVFVYLQFN